MIKLGDKNIVEAKLGSLRIVEMRLGDKVVWSYPSSAIKAPKEDDSKS